MGILLPTTQQRINELKDRDAEQLAENKRQNEIVRQARIAQQQADRDAVNAEREQERLAEEEELKRHIQENFVSNNLPRLWRTLSVSIRR